MSKNAETGKLKVDHCVVSFKRSDDLKEFEKHFNEVVEDLK